MCCNLGTNLCNQVVVFFEIQNMLTDTIGGLTIPNFVNGNPNYWVGKGSNGDVLYTTKTYGVEFVLSVNGMGGAYTSKAQDFVGPHPIKSHGHVA